MEAAVAVLKLVGTVLAIVGLTFTLLAHHTARIAAASAANSAASAVADRLGHDWNCTATGTDWTEAKERAATIVADRLKPLGSVTPVGLTVTASSWCAVIVTVEASALGTPAWLNGRAVRCIPTQASAQLARPSPCGLEG